VDCPIVTPNANGPLREEGAGYKTLTELSAITSSVCSRGRLRAEPADLTLLVPGIFGEADQPGSDTEWRDVVMPPSTSHIGCIV